MRYASQGHPGFLDDVAIELQRGSDRYQCKRVRGTVTNLQVVGVLRKLSRWQFYRGNQLIG
ncbi:hypothetical protein D3C81_1951700 [compost metagenome]